MRDFCKNIIFLLLIITTLIFLSCNDIKKSYCKEIFNFSYTENDTIIKNNIVIAEKCSQKYHKDPVFFSKLSQIYYLDAVNDYSKQQYLTSANKLFLALDYINIYISKIDNTKTYDYQFRAEIYERLGDIYNDVNNLKQASTLYNNALSDYENANNKSATINLLIKIGKLYQYNHIHDIAMIYFEMAEENSDKNQNIFRKIIDNKIVTLYELNDYTKADSIFDNHFNVKIQDYDYHSAIGTKYFYERNYEKALPHLIYCFENGNLQEKLSTSEKLAETFFNLKDHEKELFYIQYQAKNNSVEIRKTPLKLDLEKIFDNHHDNINDNTSSNRNRNRNRNRNKNIYLYILLIVTWLFIICGYIYLEKKKRKSDTSKKEEKIIAINPENISQKPQKEKQSFEDAYKSFTESSIYMQIISSFEGLNILTKNTQEHNELCLSNKDLMKVIRTFNNCFPNAISTIKNEYKSITASDIRFIILSFMELKDVEIAVLLGLTYGATNKRSNKLKNIFNTKDDLHTFLTNYIQSKH